MVGGGVRGSDSKGVFQDVPVVVKLQRWHSWRHSANLLLCSGLVTKPGAGKKKHLGGFSETKSSLVL